MRFLKLIIVATLVVATIAKDDSSKSRDKRQQVAFYPRRGARPPPYAVQMEPIVQYSQRDPLYNPLASSKSDDFYEEGPLNYYPTEPEPIIEIIIKESNESLPTPVPPPPPPTPRPTKEPIQVFYVKYEKKKGYGDKTRVVYDPPVPALTPVEEHEEIKPDNPAPYPEEPVHTATPAPSEPSTTLRAIIRPDSEVYHSGSSGIRVTFGTDQVPPNNHNKRSDLEIPPTQYSKPAASPPGSPKRQHGPYQPIQPVHQRVSSAFPQQRIANSFPPQTLHQPPQQPPLNFLQQQSAFPPPPPQTRNPLPRPQRLPITIQGLPEVQQRAPFSGFNGPPHRVSINHPQQPGFPPTLSVSHQSVQIQNQPIPINQGSHFNVDQPQPVQQQQQQPQPQSQPQPQPQQQQPLSIYKQQELEKQRYHEQRRQQELLKHREHQRQHEQQRLQEHQRFLEQQRQSEQQRHVDQHRQIEQQRLVEQQRHQEQLRQQDHQRLQEQQRIQEQQRAQEQQRIQEQQRLQDQQRLQEQRRRKQEQEQKLLQEQQYRTQFKYNQPQPVPGISQVQSQTPKPGGEIFKAVPKLEQHYAIRENPLHPGPFPPNPIIQPTGFPEPSQNQYSSLQSPSPSPESQPLIRNSQHQFINDQQQHLNTKQQIFQTQQQGFFSQNLPNSQQQQQQQQQQPQPQQQRFPSSSQRSSIWARPSFSLNPSQKIYATPVTNTEDFNAISTIRPFISSTTPTTTITTTTPTTTTTTEPPTTTTVSPKNEAKIRENIANLPDEVPDDIREQLLSSGILGNADIQILDYDKVGDIPIEKLPPEALANFYGAGGASAVAASEPVPAIIKKPKTAESSDSSATSSSSVSSAVLAKKTATSSSTKFEQATLRPGGVEMKVVRFDPNTEQGQALANQHIRDDATKLNPVTVGARDEAQYNRYLPLKVSGASFPIPDVPQLNGRKISSVVVLAPVDYNFQEEKEIESRQGRRASDVQAVKFLAGETLKQLVKKPTAENYKKWLEQESRTEPQKQSVVLLVTMPVDVDQGEKEIFMYDVVSQSVSKLSGDLSTAFVDAAESNSDSNFDDSNFTSH